MMTILMSKMMKMCKIDSHMSSPLKAKSEFVFMMMDGHVFCRLAQFSKIKIGAVRNNI